MQRIVLQGSCTAKRIANMEGKLHGEVDAYKHDNVNIKTINNTTSNHLNDGSERQRYSSSTNETMQMETAQELVTSQDAIQHTADMYDVAYICKVR